ncbi:hypothetical protein ACG04Q_20800 [Roseateles sp. DXS20W]|uniref:DUF4365 domain-containing protein n=1 Tax=Pelomonas lactea TaxID=3299030 RepID=A0ABW7GQ05_9BURK
MATSQLQDVTGSRGESVVYLCLTDYSGFAAPLFRAAFLGDKWPALDFYVELRTTRGAGLYFFGQAKSTALPLKKRSRVLPVTADRDDVDRLLRIPAPTYVLGVHEPSKRVFIRAVHSGTPSKSISSIPLTHELTPAALQVLHDEVVAYWGAVSPSKPSTSAFT